MKKVHVKPVFRTSAQNRQDYYHRVGSTAVPSGRTRGRDVKIKFSFVRNSSGTKLMTGMDDLVINPYYEKELSDLPPGLRPRGEWEQRYDSIKDKEKITRQMLLEIRHNQPKGTYTSNVTIPMMSQMIPVATDHIPTALESYSLYLDDDLHVFEAGTIEGDLAIQLVQNHPKIAKTKDEINQDFHDFYISNVEEELIEENRKTDKFMELVAAGQDVLDNMDPFILYQIAIVLKLFKRKPTVTALRATMQKYVTDKARNEQGSLDQRHADFMALYKLAKGDHEARARLYMMYLVRQAINEQIFVLNKGNYFWPSQRAYDNWYRLGSNEKVIIDRFLKEYLIYDPELDENFFFALETEVDQRNLQIEKRQTTTE